ncbi:MAG: hypothetical protein C4532_00085 [Candidatus Abyssobacteria bacterium SURF_17]|jgi:hypothetical protein|uniref:Uncharacterized protein n=1 Tax=Candidatus Abyssobacteria bacterium SURF_17 TaxID=2093361 RepID=A0A419FA42_9BACT|nr:MAG: hypothetical protein C4532_00085 [Candidatus Abyssubacteria bacterium SURF_17]
MSFAKLRYMRTPQVQYSAFVQCSFRTAIFSTILLIWAVSGPDLAEATEMRSLSSTEMTKGKTSAVAVCPPFHLKDENGTIIDPLNEVNSQVPYSPKQTCGAQGCHDYAKITEGFHFQAGRGEALTDELARRYDWVTTPGYYGGRW